MKRNNKLIDRSSDFCSLVPNWWVFILRGIFAIIFGGLAIYNPLATLLTMTLFFGAYATIDGVLSLIAAINRSPKKRQWWGLISSGVVSILAGLGVLMWPQIASISVAAFLWGMISAWSLTTGIFQIAAAIRLRTEIKDEWLLGLGGILYVILGLILFMLFLINPLASIITVGFLIGINALAYGIVQLGLAFKLVKEGGYLANHDKSSRVADIP